MRRTPAAGLIRTVEHEIYLVRGQRVLLDASLAGLYGVRTSSLNLAVKRNRGRFPQDFMFVLTEAEVEILRLQIETSRSGWGGRRYLPQAFTEAGVAMLSSVLRSPRAVRMNIAIMRAFIHMRQLLAEDPALRARVERLEAKQRLMTGVLEEIIEEIQGERRSRGRRAIGFAAGK